MKSCTKAGTTCGSCVPLVTDLLKAELKKADRVYCEGTIKIDNWRGDDGTEKHGLSVSSFKIEKTHRIGRDRPQREKSQKSQPAATGRDRAARSDYTPIGRTGADLNDDIPF